MSDKLQVVANTRNQMGSWNVHKLKLSDSSMVLRVVAGRTSQHSGSIMTKQRELAVLKPVAAF
jgi:hypothetical protein